MEGRKATRIFKCVCVNFDLKKKKGYYLEEEKSLQKISRKKYHEACLLSDHT